MSVLIVEDHSPHHHKKLEHGMKLVGFAVILVSGELFAATRPTLYS